MDNEKMTPRRTGSRYLPFPSRELAMLWRIPLPNETEPLPPATGNSQGHRAHNVIVVYPARYGCKSKWRAERGPGESCVRAGQEGGSRVDENRGHDHEDRISRPPSYLPEAALSPPVTSSGFQKPASCE